VRHVQQLAEDVWQLSGFPKHGVNVYVVGDVLVDAGTRLDRGRILKQVRDRDLAAHALTHAHPDHYGSSHVVCERLDVPLWCGAADAEAVEHGKMVGPGGRMLPGPHAHPVARRLHEGDELAAGFTVLDTPGHSPGHVSFWREADRTLISGDVMWGWNPFLLRGPLREPPALVTPDVARNRESARRIAALEPALVCFGHGPPLRDPAKLAAAVAKLPR
jgi:glyoxylase-like metal-dependent hydrolase (beta-lactamase superfamily II)